MATSQEEKKQFKPLGEEWAPPDYSCTRHTKWVVPPQPDQWVIERSYMKKLLLVKLSDCNMICGLWYVY